MEEDQTRGHSGIVDQVNLELQLLPWLFLCPQEISYDEKWHKLD